MLANLETSNANNQSSKIRLDNSINSKINDLKIKFKNLEQEVTNLSNESNENQKKVQDEENLFVRTKALEQEEIEKHKADKQEALSILKTNIEKTEYIIKNYKFFIKKNNSDITENKNLIENLKKKNNEHNSKNKKLKDEMNKTDKKINKPINDSLQLIGNEKQIHKHIDLMFLEVDDSSSSKIFKEQIEALNTLIKTNYKLINENNEKIKDLSSENDFLDQQIKERKEFIEEKKNNLDEDAKNKKILIEEIKALEAKMAKENKETNIILKKNHEKKEKELFEYKESINHKTKDIINLFNNFKNIEEKINNDYEFFDFLKSKIDEFLKDYFIKEKINIGLNHHYLVKTNSNSSVNDQSPNTGLLAKYEQNIKTLKDYIKEKNQNTERYKSALSILENFSNDNKSRIQYDSNVITQLTTNPKAIMKIKFLYQHFLQEEKFMYLHLLCINSTDINKKEKSFFYFAKMFLFEELNEDDKKIFEELKKRKGKNKNISFDNSQKYAFLIIEDEKRSIEFLINFSMVIKLDKKFISILNTREKICDLDNKIFKEIKANFKKKNKKLINFCENNHKNNATNSNNIIANIKKLENLYEQVIKEKEELTHLQTLLSNFRIFLETNIDKNNRILHEIKIKSDSDFGRKTLEKTLAFLQEIVELDIFTFNSQANDNKNINASHQNPQPSNSGFINLITNDASFPVLDINNQADDILSNSNSRKSIGKLSLTSDNWSLSS